MHNSNSAINFRNNNHYLDQEFNNKLALQCSYLINEIKRKNRTLLLPIHISNKKIYLHNKILTNKKSLSFFKKTNNIKKLISKNETKKYLSKNLIQRQNNKIIIRKRNNYDTQTDITYNNNRNIPLTSLYNIPTIKKEGNTHMKSIIFVNKNNKINKSLTQEKDESNQKNNKKKNEFMDVENYMREKFFVDTENKLKNKIQTKYFRNDGLIKDQIIYLQKFGIFWKGFIQYCTPIIRLKKYQIDYKNKKKQNEINNSNRSINRNILKMNIYNRTKALSLPKINYIKNKDKCK
jgi:hypothetical protein